MQVCPYTQSMSRVLEGQQAVIVGGYIVFGTLAEEEEKNFVFSDAVVFHGTTVVAHTERLAIAKAKIAARFLGETTIRDDLEGGRDGG